MRKRLFLSEPWQLELDEYLTARKASGWKENTARSSAHRLSDLFRHLAEAGLFEVAEVTTAHIMEYLTAVRARAFERAIVTNEEKYARDFTFETRKFFAWAKRTGKVLVDPAEDVEVPRAPQRLPRNILTHNEMARLLEAPDITTPVGLRNRAIIELAYSSATRAREMINLDLADVDTVAHRAFVRQGKWGKDRMVPIGATAARCLDRYLQDGRVLLERDGSNHAFFLTDTGRRIKYTTILDMLEKYGEAIKLGKRPTPHLLRHTCATHMVEGGADIRYVQMLLGHESVSTTEIYAHLVQDDLAAAHRRFHPRGGG